VGGGGVKTVEVDEDYLSGSQEPKGQGRSVKRKAGPQGLSLVERGGNIRSMFLEHRNVRSALVKHLHKAAVWSTDGARRTSSSMPTNGTALNPLTTRSSSGLAVIVPTKYAGRLFRSSSAGWGT